MTLKLSTPIARSIGLPAEARSTPVGADELHLFFDEKPVTRKASAPPGPDMGLLKPDQYDYWCKATQRLAQRPGSYIVPKYVRSSI